MSTAKEQLLHRIQTREARAGVVGLGYVGLPLAVEIARSGLACVGIDVDSKKVSAISRGESYIPDVPSADVQSLLADGRLSATTDFSVVAELDTVNICVPTPLRKTKEPDLSYIVSAVEAIASAPPSRDARGPRIDDVSRHDGGSRPAAARVRRAEGRRRLLPGVLARARRSGQRDVQYPQRAKGRRRHVGGVRRGSRAPSIARPSRRSCPSVRPRVAEMVKLLENTFRAVNIGLVNEIALMCDRIGIDVWEVVDAAKTKPFGFMPFYPGPGLGGHCIPIDPFYLSWKARQYGFEPRFIELAGHINAAMPHATVDKIAAALNVQKKPMNGAHILVAGISYKRDIDDMRESPALDVMGLLHQQGARLQYADPLVPRLAGRSWLGGYDLESLTLDAANIARADCVAILTDHTAFDYDALVSQASLVVDTRNAIKRAYPHVFTLGAPQPAYAAAFVPADAIGPGRLGNG